MNTNETSNPIYVLSLSTVQKDSWVIIKARKPKSNQNLCNSLCLVIAKETFLKVSDQFKAFMTEFSSVQHIEEIGYEIAGKPGP